MPQHDDKRLLAQLGGSCTSVDERVARELDPERYAADLFLLNAQLDPLDDATTTVVAARPQDGAAGALAVFDTVDQARQFHERFRTTGVPSLWPCRTIVCTWVFAVDMADEETAGKLRDVPRGRWLFASVTDDLIDPLVESPPVVAGGLRAARRRDREKC